ncbi:alpha-(1,3)-fucosyltransferase 6-like [Elysia marginata]|uniref:Fucosyltransferase n=1 Tax=Elysia marginata TaxID=1093978 RepID=A0AAV4GFZ8_9GAST|nr:alpha-(1,3)-fucosyltransferase 6-like [Elysia marginata]
MFFKQVNTFKTSSRKRRSFLWYRVGIILFVPSAVISMLVLLSFHIKIPHLTLTSISHIDQIAGHGDKSTRIENEQDSAGPDLRRDATLMRVSSDIGIAPNHRSKFLGLCRVLTPINFCAEFARLAQLKRCATDHCTDEVKVPNYVITKDDVENVVRKGVGLLRIETLGATREQLTENEMTLNPSSLLHHTSQSDSSQSNISTKSLPQRPSEFPNVAIPGPSNIRENTELYAAYNPDSFFEDRDRRQTAIVPADRKIILWYAPTRYWPKVSGLLPLRGCPEFPCVVTRDRKHAHTSAAMIFSGDVTPQHPPKRRPDQIFVFQNHEPPNRFFLDGSSPAWRSAFNWTMTYRHDSDIVRPYGLIRRKRASELTSHDPILYRKYASIFKNKTKMVAAMVSNCDASSRRNDYIRELSRHIQVDVYGKCGNLNCPRGEDDKCFKEISAKYKFYLAFENAICEDYITEKFFRFFNMDLVVVARGSNQYYIHAPKETFINSADFRSPTQLADYLKYLSDHPEEYITILKTKDQYTAVFQDWPILDVTGQTNFHHYAHESLPVCQICQRLWNLDNYAKTIPDIKTWFTQKMCKKKEEIRDIGPFSSELVHFTP